MNKKNKELIIYFISSGLVSVLGFIMSILYSRMFSPSNYGEFAIAFSTYNLMLNLYSGWITSAIIRCFQEYENKNQTDKFYGSFFQLQIFMGLLFFIIPNIVIFSLNISKLFKTLFFFLTIAYFFEENMAIINTMLRAQKRVKQYNINTVLNNILRISILLIMYYILHIESIIIIVLSILLTEVIQYIYSVKKLKLLKYYKQNLFDIKIIKEMFKFGFPLVGVALTSWILSTSDRYIIRFFYTEKEVGLYSYAYSLGNNLFKLLIQFIILAAYPNIVKAWENEGKEKTENVIKYYLRLYFLIIIPSIFGVIAVAKDFFEGFTDVRYHESYLVFVITCISIAAVGLSQYTNKAWELNKNTKKILLLNIISAIVNIVLNIVFIPLFGYFIAVVTTLISYVFYLIISLILSRNILRLKINLKSVIKVIISSIVMYCAILIFKYYAVSISLHVIYKLLIELIIGIFTYAIMIIMLKEINKEEVKKIVEEIKNRQKKINS